MIHIKENFLSAMEGIAANKIRAILTMLGIVIGIASVVTIVTVGGALSGSVSNSLSRLGAANIMVSLQNRDAESLNYLSGSLTESDRISDDMIEQYAERYKDSIEAISEVNMGSAGQARNGGAYANVTLMGVNEGHQDARNIKMLEGHPVNADDLKASRYVAVVSDKLVSNLYPDGKDCLGQSVKIDSPDGLLTFTIIGVYKYEPNLLQTAVTESDQDIRTYVYVPLTTLYAITPSSRGYLSITVKVNSDVDIVSFTAATNNFFNRFYQNNPRFNISTVSLDSMMSVVKSVMGALSIAVDVIAGISLLVGGIGVMNIMLVSVTERTNEIGMRKALGARDLAIQIQFIVEAVIISGLGGIMGTIAGITLGYIGSSLLDRPMLPNVSTIAVSVLFSMLIGIFFGFYPANKAAKLDPAAALRYE